MFKSITNLGKIRIDKPMASLIKNILTKFEEYRSAGKLTRQWQQLHEKPDSDCTLVFNTASGFENRARTGNNPKRGLARTGSLLPVK